MTPPAVQEAFTYQTEACASLGSPFMAQLCKLFAERNWPQTDLRDRVSSWSGDLSPRGESVPLRVAGGLHALYLERQAFDEIYPPATVSDDVLWDAVKGVLIDHDDFLCDWVKSAPQTNEVRRSSAIIAAAGELTAGGS